VEKKDFRILVVDDDEIARDVVSSILAREGYPVITAMDGTDAIRMLTFENVNLVLTDLRMPGAGGIEVLKHAIRSNPDVSVVILTAYGTLDTALEAIKEGAYDYLTKPFKIQEILILAERAFRKTALIDENKELVRHLRDTYRDMEIIRTVSDSYHPEITAGWLERIERLKEMKVISAQDSDILKKRLVNGNGKGKG
jgi:two-component system response regulator PilR (NtrC family)